MANLVSLFYIIYFFFFIYRVYIREGGVGFPLKKIPHCVGIKQGCDFTSHQEAMYWHYCKFYSSLFIVTSAVALRCCWYLTPAVRLLLMYTAYLSTEVWLIRSHPLFLPTRSKNLIMSMFSLVNILEISRYGRT